MQNIDLNELLVRACMIVRNDSSIKKGRAVEYGLMLVVTKLTEAALADQEERRADRSLFGVNEYPGTNQDIFEYHVKNTLEDKLADAVILLLAFAAEGNIDINSWAYPLNAIRFESFFSQKPAHITDCIYQLMIRFVREKDVHSAIRRGIAGCFALADGYDIDLSWYILRKMEYNEFILSQKS